MVVLYIVRIFGESEAAWHDAPKILKEF